MPVTGTTLVRPIRYARSRRALVLLAATVVSLLASSLSGGIALGAKSAATQTPDTTITASPPNPSASTSASFSFSSTKSPATFTCKLDTGSSTACTSPTTYNGRAAGSHTFSVFATVKGVSDPTPATSTWVIDLTPPSVPTGLAATTPTATSVKLTWNASTDNLAIGGYNVIRDGAPLASVGSVLVYTDSTVLAGSTHTYAVQARDTAGNVSPLSTSVSATTPTPPDTFIDTAPPIGTSSTSASFTFHSSPAGATFTCKLDAGSAGACTSPKSYTSLTQAVHTFSVYATLRGLVDPTPATASWTIDTTAPSAPTGLAASSLSSTSVQLTWTAATDNLGVTGYRVLRDGVLLATIGAVTTYTDGTVPAGTYPAYTLQAFDVAGNLSPLTAPVSAPPPPAPFDPALTRMTYLTDLVGLNATVNFATNQSGTLASVSFGPASGSSCSLTTTVPATRFTVAVNGVYEYQWKAVLALPAPGSYCYRAYLGATDLLAANPSPVFQTQVPLGSTEAFSFAVLGDWGETDATGANPYQAGVMSQIAKSGARFAITAGDQGYPSGNQNDYGDLQSQLAGIFGLSFWGGVGSDLAIFPIIGNHGFANNSAVHPHLGNWPQGVAVATSSGSYQVNPYPSINGSSPANYPDTWYAFSAGNARFYMLTATWADGNVGTGSVYGNDYLAHWTSTSPEYLWLKADLAAHPSGLKFTFFHYPLYSDQPSENGDTFLQGNSSLEGFLSTNGVNIAFNGHAHIYERNAPTSGRGVKSLVSYVTGGGGGQAQSLGTCGPNDRYAVGWSYTNSVGSACGTAPVPTSPSQVHHFLKVTINGGSVTVTPTDSTGRTFDVQTFTFSPKPDTFIDSGPAAGTTSTSATFTFHASSTSATYTCKLDAATAASCTSPTTYSSLANGSHTFSVYATVGGVVDPLPATWTWTVDTIAPAAPTGFAAIATSPFSVQLTWIAATDNLAVTGYDVYRDGALLAGIAPATSYVDNAVVGSSTHTYAVLARDIAGNVSGLTSTISVTTPPPPAPVWADGFESGDLSAWGSNAGLTVQGADIHGGAYAAEGDTTTGSVYAKKTLPSTYADAYARVWFLVKSQTSQVNLLRMRDATGGSIGYVYIETTGQLGFHNDAIGSTGTNFLSATIPGPGWHALELHVLTGGSGGAVDLWLDNVRISDLSGTGITTSTNPVGAFQVGETQNSSQVYDVVFDDVAFGTARLGPVPDSPPTVPTGLTATASTPYGSVALGWTASSDDVGIAGYDIFRDGTLIASTTGLGTSYTDSSVLASTSYVYAVRARDTSGNRSASSDPATATTPAASSPVWADGFESGTLSSWTSKAGLNVESTDVHQGSFAAEGATTTGAYAKVTLPSTYTDAYARVWFEVKALGGNDVTVLRLRDAPLTSIGYAYVTSGGKLAFRSDAATTGTTSRTSVGTGWHSLELHLGIATGTVEIWLDGNLVTDLSGAGVNLGSNPVGILQVGDTGGTFDFVFDDAAFGTARLGPTPDAPPTAPTTVAAGTVSAFSVGLTWSGATDDLGIAGYDISRGGTVIASLGNVASYTDATVSRSSTYSYTVRTRDTSGNRSAPSSPLSVTTPAPPAPLFADAFESGNLSAWNPGATLLPESADVHGGTFAVEGTSGTFAKKTLPTTYTDAYARVWFKIKTQGSQVTLVRLRDSLTTSIGYVYVTSSGKLGFRADATSGTTGSTSSTTVGVGWHAVELHLGVTGGTVEVWLDGTLVTDLSSTGGSLGANAVSVLQIGDTASNTSDLLYDDAAFGTARLGPAAAAPPSVPANLAATTPSLSSVALTWAASSGALGVAGYDVFRDGSYLASIPGTATSYLDGTVGAASTHAYAVRAWDISGNRSALSASVSATTPADQPPSVPQNVSALAPTPYAVNVAWTASSDDVGVVGYDVYRDGSKIVSLGAVTTYNDVVVHGGMTYQYTVLAWDGAGHSSAQSAPATVPVPAVPAPVFADGFESGNPGAWTSSAGLTVESADVRSGGFAAEGNTTNGNTVARKTLVATYVDAYARVAFLVKSQTSQINLLRLSDATGSSIGYMYIAATTGRLTFHDDTTGTNTTSVTSPGGGWHVLELHLGINGASSTVEVWLDGALVADLSSTSANLGTAPVGRFQIGDAQTARTYDVVYDDAAFGTARIGL